VRALELTVCALCFSSTAAGAQDLDAWINAGTAALPASPTYRALDARRQSSEAFVDAALEQSPWTLRSTVRHDQIFPRTPRAWGLGASTEVEYRRRSGWVGTLAGAVNYVDIADANLPFSVDLTVGYDVIGGGDDSAGNDRAEAFALRSISDALSAESTRIDARLRFIDDVASIYAAQCKKKRVEELRKVVGAALSAAQIQLDSKVISQADFLNFRFLDDSFVTRLTSAEIEQRLALERLEAWGPAVVETVRALSGQPIDCDRVKKDRTVMMTPEAVTALAERQPQHAARRADRLAAAYDARATRTEQRPALVPSVGGTFGRISDQEVVTAHVGVAFDWNIPQSRGHAAETATRLAVEAATVRIEESLASSVAFIRQLIARVESERRLLDVLARSTASSEQLARVLDVQRAIGDIDALNQATALLNAVDLKLAVVDSGVRLESAYWQLETLKQAPIMSRWDQHDAETSTSRP